MREMQEGMEARVELTMRPYVKDGVAGMVVKATAYPYLSVAPEVRQSVSLSVSTPRLSNEMVAAATFRLLLALDYEVSKAWSVRQET